MRTPRIAMLMATIPPAAGQNQRGHALAAGAAKSNVVSTAGATAGAGRPAATDSIAAPFTGVSASTASCFAVARLTALIGNAAGADFSIGVGGALGADPVPLACTSPFPSVSPALVAA